MWGFWKNAKYPDDTPIAYIAAINEFGATIERQPSQITNYRQVNAARTKFNSNGRFVKKADANFATTHAVGAYSITIPARPFFRGMIAAESPHWGADIGKLLVSTKYDVTETFTKMGQEIADELQQAIKAFTNASKR